MLTALLATFTTALRASLLLLLYVLLACIVASARKDSLDALWYL